MSDPHPLGPFFGSLPPDVLREVLLPKLDHLSRGFFALAAGVLARGEGCRTVQRGGHGFAVRVSRGGWPHGVAEVRAPARVPVGYSHVRRSRSGGTWGVFGLRQNSAARGMNERVKWQRVTDSLRHAQETGCPWDGHEHGCAMGRDDVRR